MKESQEEEAQEQEEKLLDKLNRNRKRILRNRLLMVTLLNFITFFSFIFAMAYYQWIWVSINFSLSPLKQNNYNFWINLLYIREDHQGAQYEHFSTVQKRICDNDIYCKSLFYEFTFVGYLCFSIIVVAGSLQLFDFIRMFYLIVKIGAITESKDDFRHLVTIFTYLVGLTLSAFSIEIMSPNQFKFGLSFWIGVGTLCFFVIVIVYQQYSIRSMIKQSLVADLIDKEKKIRANQIQKNYQISQSREDQESVKQGEGISL